MGLVGAIVLGAVFSVIGYLQLFEPNSLGQAIMLGGGLSIFTIAMDRWFPW